MIPVLQTFGKLNLNTAPPRAASKVPEYRGYRLRCPCPPLRRFVSSQCDWVLAMYSASLSAGRWTR